MLFTVHKLKCDNGHYTNTVVAENETLEENLKNSLLEACVKVAVYLYMNVRYFWNFNHLNCKC